jgi:hypothetical protein
MRALQIMDQVAGNDWGSSARAMLHEIISVDRARDVDFSYANSMFDDLERQMRASEAEFGNSIKTLREKYIFSNVEAIEHFIGTHRMVAQLLIEAAPQFEAAFGNRAPLTLEIMPDDEAPQSIYALAQWDGDSTRARDALRAFDDGWLGRNFQAVNGRIVFDYELI